MKITLANLAQATAQQVFDQVAEHLLKQNCRSFYGSEPTNYAGCAYRGAHGMMCAAGCLIADDEYNPEMEGVSWHNLGLYETPHDFLISSLQSTHDNVEPHDWVDSLKLIAEDNNLEWKFSDEA